VADERRESNCATLFAVVEERSPDEIISHA
jgi:hypothetical protein